MFSAGFEVGPLSFVHSSVRSVILMTYFMKTIGADPMTSTLVLQTFLFGSFCSPFLGAVLADGFLGKFSFVSHQTVAFAPCS